MVGVAGYCAVKSEQLAAKTANFTACKICRHCRRMDDMEPEYVHIVLLEYCSPLWGAFFLCVYLMMCLISIYCFLDFYVKLFVYRY